MEDLKNLQKHIEKEFGFKGLQIAIHRDEGHYDDNGKFVTNEHAHLSFFTLDRQNGRQMFRREHINRDKLRDLQTQTANILNMDRGKSKEETGRERLSHKDYKQAKQMESAKLKELQATKEQLKEANNQMRIFMKENGANRNDYAQLEQAKKELEEKLKAKDLTEKELLEKFQELEKNFKKEKGHLTSLIEVKEIDNLDLKNQNKSLQQQKEVLASKVIALEQKTASSSNMSDLEVKAELQNIVNEEIEVKNVKTGVFSTEKAPVIKDSKSFFKRVQDLASRGTQGVMNTIENLKREITQLKSFVKSLQTENANLKAKVRELESEAPKQIEVLKPEFQKIVEQAKEINENKKPIDKFKEIQKEVIEKQLEEKTTRRERRR
jgi:predicted RNase H-like nuclease (RuvC/YqgF family)